jgi:hypothetical protein
MADHSIQFILNDVSEQFGAIRTTDDPDAILQAFHNHIKSGAPELIEVNVLDSMGTYTDTVVVRLSRVASVRVTRGARPGRVKLTVTTSTEKAASPKKKVAKKAARKKKVARKKKA